MIVLFPIVHYVDSLLCSHPVVSCNEYFVLREFNGVPCLLEFARLSRVICELNNHFATTSFVSVLQ